MAGICCPLKYFWRLLDKNCFNFFWWQTFFIFHLLEDLNILSSLLFYSFILFYFILVLEPGLGILGKCYTTEFQLESCSIFYLPQLFLYLDFFCVSFFIYYHGILNPLELPIYLFFTFIILKSFVLFSNKVFSVTVSFCEIAIWFCYFSTF